MRELVSEALRFATAVEQKCYDFYRRAAAAAADPAGRQVFERLAFEEAGHIEVLRHACRGSRYEAQNGRQPVPECDFGEPQGKTINQLRLAMLNKQFCIDLYATLARCFREPSVCRIFDRALLDAHRELKSIRQEYLKGDPPTGISLIARRPRRTHTVGGIHPSTPNKHSQLYFSMQDSGRQTNLG